MKIALVRPGTGSQEDKKYSSRACLEPLSLGILSALTPSEHEVDLIDDYFDEIDYSVKYDAVALTSATFQARRSYEIADRFRANGAKVILGGFHPAFCSSEALEHADSVCTGDAELLWQDALRDLQKNQLKKIYRPDSGARLAERWVLPDRSLLQSRKYLPLSLVQFSRGCRYRCDFCSIQNFYSRKNSQFLIENVIADVESAKNRWIFFVDDNILGDIKKLKEFLKELIPLKISWMTQISIDFADDEELMNLMTESGCRAVILGLETLNQKTIRQMKKNWARVGSYSERLKKIQSAGIMIYGSFVFGYDADRSDDISYTLEFALEQKMLLANFNMLQPYPGTSLYDRLKKEGRLMYEAWWLDENYRYGDVVFHPRGMSAEELSEGCRKARHAFHSYSSIAKRFFNFQSHLIHYRNAFLYAIVNYSSRQDVIKKEGMRLGASVS